MKGLTISCPECGAHFSLLHALEDSDGRRFLGLLQDVQPMIVRPLLRYLTLFKPLKQGMRWSRMYTLAKELVPLIKAAQIKHNGGCYVVPPQKWADTMLALVETPSATLKLPLKSHGYLYAMLAGDAESVAAKKEQKQIVQARNRGKTGIDKSPDHVSTALSDQYRASGKTPLSDAFKNTDKKEVSTND